MKTCPDCGAGLEADSSCFRCLLETGLGEEGLGRAERIFRIALSYDAAGRMAFMDQAAAGDAALRDELQMLWEGYVEAGGDEALPTMGETGDARSHWATIRREEPGTVIDHFRLIRVIGEGGMGSVWEAEQREPIQRRVALKIIKLGMDTEEVVRRFGRERQALARMKHAHIAQVFEAGATLSGRPYFAMELVEGEAITLYSVKARLEVRARLELFLQVCEAVEHAHQKGIIHRDLKPSNILVSAGVAKVIDFGIAKATQEETGDGLLTRQAQVLGTPAYMSPEQAESEGADVDTRTDVYSLGAILYELLSGTLPFDPKRLGGTGGREIQRILKEEEPALPSTRITVSRAVPPLPVMPVEVRGDLDWIVMKALSKERSRRYASAAAFGEDIRRFLVGKAVRAVPPTWAYRSGKFIRRNRAAVAAGAAVLLALTSGLVVSLVQMHRANVALAGEAQARAEATFTVADLYTRSGLAAAGNDDGTRAALWFAGAARTAAGDPVRAESNRMRAAAWTAEARVPVRAFETGLPHIEAITFHPAGRAVILTAVDGTGAQLWDLETEKQSPLTAGGIAVSADWDASGTRLALSGGGHVRVLDYPSGKVLAEVAASPQAQVAFRPDGGEVAVGADDPFLWNWKTAAVRPAAQVPGGIKRVRWSRDGRFVLWQTMNAAGVCSGEEPERLRFDPLPVQPRALADFIGGTDRFFHSSGAGGGTVQDAASGAVAGEIAGTDYVVAASGDGQWLARSQGPLWSASGGTRQFPRHRENGVMESACFSPDGRILATASYDATVRLWSVSADQPLGLAGWHQHPVQCVAFSPDGTLLASSQIGLVRLWRVALPGLASPVATGAGSLVVMSGDGRFFVPSGLTHVNSSLRQTRVYGAQDGQPAGPELRPEGIILDAAFLPAGALLALAVSTTPDRPQTDWTSSGGTGRLELWNWQTGARTAVMDLPSEPRGLAVHPSGAFIAAYCGGGQGVEWERSTGRLQQWFARENPSPPQHTLTNGRTAYADGGRFLLAWGEVGTLQIRDRLEDRSLPVPSFPVGSVIYDIALKDQVVALCAAGPSAPLVDVLDLRAGGAAAAKGLPHSDWLYHASFDETGELLLTSGRRPVVQIWNWRVGNLAGPALQHESEVMAGVFVPGTPWVITGAHDGFLRFWDRRSGMPVRPPLQLPGLILQLVLTPEGKTLIAAGFPGGEAVQRLALDQVLPPLAPGLDPDGGRLLAEINATAYIHESGGLVPLTGEAWLARWQEFRRRFPDYPGHRLGN